MSLILENGEISISLVNGRPGAKVKQYILDFYLPYVNNWICMYVQYTYFMKTGLKVQVRRI